MCQDNLHQLGRHNLGIGYSWDAQGKRTIHWFPK